MKKVILIAVMAIFSSGVFAAESVETTTVKKEVVISNISQDPVDCSFVTSCNITVHGICDHQPTFHEMMSVNDAICDTEFAEDPDCDDEA